MNAVGAYIRSLNPCLPRATWALELGGLVNAFGNGVVYPFLFIYLHNVRGFSLATSGLVIGTNAAVALAAGPLAGAVVDRIGSKRTLAGALVLLTAAFALFPLVRQPWHAFAVAGLVGLGNGAFWPSYHALLAAITPAGRRHAGYALQRVSANLGFGAGGAVAGFVAATARPHTFTILFVLDAVTYAVFLGLLAIVPSARAGEIEAEPTGRTGYREALRHRVFVALLGLNVVFVVAGYALLETLPVFAKNQVGVS